MDEWTRLIDLALQQLIHLKMYQCMRGGGLGSSTILKNLMSPTPRRKWYLTMGRRAHKILENGTRPHPPTSPRTFFGSRPQPPTSHIEMRLHSLVPLYSRYGMAMQFFKSRLRVKI